MKKYDLQERTFQFAKRVREFAKLVAQNLSNTEDLKQLIRASGSVGANYVEANGALGKRDFQMKIKISKKEANESRFFLRLIDPGENQLAQKEQQRLIQEATELASVFGAILRNSE